MTVTLALILCLLPLGILKAEKKIKSIKLLGSVVVCYLVGVLLGNMLPVVMVRPVAMQISEVSVMLAIPLLLFTTDLLSWGKLAKSTLISFLLVIISVMVMGVLSFILFRDQVPHAAKISGMLVGVFTGGTPNLVAIGKALAVEESVFLLLNGADLLLGGVFLLILMTVGKKLFSFCLPAFVPSLSVQMVEAHEHNDWQKMQLPQQFKFGIQLVLLSVLVVGVSLGSSHLFFNELFVPYIILVMTALAIGLSCWQRVRAMPGSYELGQYFLLVFCVAIGSSANLQEIINSSGIYIAYVAVMLLGSSLLHLLLCTLFKIDRDTALITAVAAIYGPPFVGAFATLLNNREIIVTGVTCGLIGYALGNYLGIGLYYLLTV